MIKVVAYDVKLDKQLQIAAWSNSLIIWTAYQRESWFPCTTTNSGLNHVGVITLFKAADLQNMLDKH